MSIKVLIADDHPVLRYGLTAYSDPDKVVGLVRAGARGYLFKNNPPDQIVEGIRVNF